MDSPKNDLSASSDDSSSHSDNDYDLEVEEELEGAVAAVSLNHNDDDFDSDEGPYRDEPLADKEFMANYNREIRQIAERNQRLLRRFQGTEGLQTWCKCGKCSLETLQNENECWCCTEIEGCVLAMNDFEVLEDVGASLTCVTEHPGFEAVSLNNYGLRLSAGAYKRKNATRYQRTGSEKQFLRSIAYHNFTRLIHGYLGNKRIPLPACAYDAIRRKFPATYDAVRGFQDDENNE
eukprot:Seg1123.3 transcript_id=Seg1123.3/GoldUCD/mRNA.D3Y31 product="hypothetical protein" protein_id=Seg1123.3/GoldUCD/D3Y31